MIEQDIQEFMAKVSKQEVLVGLCQSGLKLTHTQEHILMILADEDQKYTNAKLATLLGISPAGVTKAMKRLQTLFLVSSEKDQGDERQLIWRLTTQGYPLAREHAAHHKRTQKTYAALAANFSSDEQVVISRFLGQLEGVL